MSNNLLTYLQIIISVLLTAVILLQAQGSGLGSSWSGGGETYHTKRGIEKVVFYLTIFLVAAFCLNALALIVNQKPS